MKKLIRISLVDYRIQERFCSASPFEYGSWTLARANSELALLLLLTLCPYKQYCDTYPPGCSALRFQRPCVQYAACTV